MPKYDRERAADRPPSSPRRRLETSGAMRKIATPLRALVVVWITAFASSLAPSAYAQENPPPTVNPTEETELGRRWLERVDPWNGIPSLHAFRFGVAAVSEGLTPSQAARLLNDRRFVAAVGSPDQGWGLLEAMIEDPATIADAWRILRREGDTITIAGVTSLQSAFFQQHPEMRNSYLADVGRMIAVRSDGVEVLVDIVTGRQVLGRDRLGIAITAPGGRPLPSPSMSPEEVAAQMWKDAGIDPNDPNPLATLERRQNLPSGPGLNLRADDPRKGLFAPASYLVLGAFLLAWLGYGAIAIARRLRRDD